MSSLPVEVVYSTSNDPLRSASQSVSGSSFWATTGMFPQLLVLRLLKPSLIARLKVAGLCAGRIRIEGALSESGDCFIPLGETDKFGDSWKTLEVSLRLSPSPVHFLRFVLDSAGSDFAALRGIQLLAN